MSYERIRKLERELEEARREDHVERLGGQDASAKQEQGQPAFAGASMESWQKHAELHRSLTNQVGQEQGKGEDSIKARLLKQRANMQHELNRIDECIRLIDANPGLEQLMMKIRHLGRF